MHLIMSSKILENWTICRSEWLIKSVSMSADKEDMFQNVLSQVAEQFSR